MKADILNNQFTLVFTTEDPPKPLPDLGPSPHPTVADITIQRNGILKLLQNLNPIRPRVQMKSHSDYSRSPHTR
jgi:hypothetical protein